MGCSLPDHSEVALEGLTANSPVVTKEKMEYIDTDVDGWW
jgi:hypothetical protein